MTPVFRAVIGTVEECHSALQHLPGRMQFMLVNDGWRGGDMRKYDKDTSLSQADALGRSPALREGRRVKITRRICSQGDTLRRDHNC